MGPLSEAISFLAVLHLCNEKNLEIKELGLNVLIVVNPGFTALKMTDSA